MNLYDMKLLDSCEKIIDGERWKILRVPGGWLFRSSQHSPVFVPFNNEFMEQVDKQKYLVEGLDFPTKDGGSFSDTSINEK